jgi:acetyl-CoA carboxylase biotin carboxyl carrier protein
VASTTWLEGVRRLLEQVRASDATEVEVTRGSFRLRVKRRPGACPPAAVEAADPGPVPDAMAAVLAPLTGVFCRASSPTTPPYVGEGDVVQPETIVGLIETMKIFNEVLAERHGRVREILVESGQLVHVGDRLMLIDEAGEERPG